MAEIKRLIAASISAIFMLTSCAPTGGIFDPKNNDHLDKELGLTRDDYRNLYEPKAGTPKEVMEDGRSALARPLMPSVAPILAAPRAPKIGKAKLVSITVTDDVPLKDVLIELSRLADVDVEIDSRITGGINFRAKDKPFNEVIERISNLAELRYSFKNDVLRVERDTAYIKNYSLDFLSMDRNSNGSIAVSTDVLSSSVGGSGGGDGGDSGGDSGGGGGSGLSTGSSANIDTSIVSDFWESLGNNIGLILNQTSQADIAALAQAEGATSADASAAFVINRQAGVLSVAASERQHDMIYTYIEKLRRNANAQVLLEAKIVEVALDEQHQSGIDWSAALGNNDLNASFIPSTFDPLNALNYTLLGSTDPASLAQGGDNNLGVGLDAAVSLAEKFGATRTLSSPRLHAINNQQAVLTFAENRIFFDLEFESEESTVSDGATVVQPPSLTGDPVSIPIGIILTMVPSINLDSGEITLNVRPTLSRQIDEEPDPVAAFASAASGQTITNNIPVIEVRELDSVMKMGSGQVLVIGGLMEESALSQENGIPGLSEIPFLGRAFKGSDKRDAKTELIIFIKATIVNIGNHGYNPVDKRVYDKFTSDPRPIAF